MSKFFLNSLKPLSTCQAETCQDCPVSKDVVCHFNASKLGHFFSIAITPFLIGGAGIVTINPWWLVPWLIGILSYFGFIEIRVMCSHCPHYAEEGTSLQCWANYGSPKLWRYRPGPMSKTENTFFYSGFVYIFVFPLIFLVAAMQWFYLLLFLLTVIGGYLTMRNLMCNHCMNFACPLNIVSNEIRQKFFDRNSVVAEAWQPNIDLEIKKPRKQ